MGFFSSIGNAISGVVGGVKDFISDTGNLVGDVASGVMGLAGNKSTNSANQAMNQAQLQLAREQFEWQKELAKNQIAWRVEDAQKAGLHPMAALGLQSTSFSPVSTSFTPMQSPDYSFLSDMGQSASYAAMKAKDRKEQAAAVRLAQDQVALQTENMNLQNEGLRIDNEYKQWQLMTAMQGGANQALNSPASARVGQKDLLPGQADSPYVDKPIVRDGWLLDEKGRKISLIPGADMKSRTEDVLGVEWFPFISSAWRDMKGRIFGHEVAGHKWDPDRGYIPVSEWNRIHKKAKKGKISVQTYEDYYRNSYRYR